MTNDQFANQVSGLWRTHGDDPRGALAAANQLVKEAGDDAQIGQLVQLIVHVYTDHLQEWQDGRTALAVVARHPKIQKGGETSRAIARGDAVLAVAGGDRLPLSQFANSDRVRILAQAAGAVISFDPSRAAVLFADALGFSDLGLEKTDAAHRTLAITANNIACSLEEQVSLNEEQLRLMLRAAEVARREWELAGNWLEVERAEYRLARSFLKAGRGLEAHRHAQECLRIVLANQGPALEEFFAYEAIALAESARQDQAAVRAARQAAEAAYAKLSDDDRQWCTAALDGLRGLGA